MGTCVLQVAPNESSCNTVDLIMITEKSGGQHVFFKPSSDAL